MTCDITPVRGGCIGVIVLGSDTRRGEMNCPETLLSLCAATTCRYVCNGCCCVWTLRAVRRRDGPLLRRGFCGIGEFFGEPK